jgi:hypothetical protein
MSKLRHKGCVGFSKGEKRVLDTGNKTSCAKSAEAIKILAAPLELQAVNGTGVSRLKRVDGEMKREGQIMKCHIS